MALDDGTIRAISAGYPHLAGAAAKAVPEGPPVQETMTRPRYETFWSQRFRVPMGNGWQAISVRVPAPEAKASAMYTETITGDKDALRSLGKDYLDEAATKAAKAETPETPAKSGK